MDSERLRHTLRTYQEWNAGKRIEKMLSAGKKTAEEKSHEFLEFGVEYAKQTILNARILAQELVDKGFKVEGSSFDYTQTHQVAVNVSELEGGDEAARIQKDNNIILNMNLLPFEPLENVENPAGMRIGVQEMTRFGMG